ncbi:MAG TPA: penicillin acylase family protein [Bryobacteraceae bacterium]|nr:penicillin acylase family protein [Bryobacteraceae bacterium]
MSHSFVRVVLKIVNVAIAVVLVAALGLIFWFVWRPLPQRSGTITAGVSAPVSVAFDSRGVPHIRAQTQEDALFVQGYVTAQDRLFQMDMLRRYAAGDLSEVVGVAALETDEESRRMRMRRIAEDAYVTLPQADRAEAAAYARGINAFIATHLNDLPLEFTLLNYQPRPWSVVDTLLICLHMFRDLSGTWKNELIKRAMFAGGEADKVNFLFPVRTGADIQPGSNAWALSGAHTASGKPLLSNDPHLQYSLPGIWYMAHLEAPGLDVSGVTLPGTPGVMIGHNQRIAWGITNLGFDSQDLYIEQIDERTGRYMYQGQMQQAREERELVRIKGAAPKESRTWVTRHGPIFARDANTFMSLRWTAAEPGVLQYPILDIDRARNWAEFNTALARFPGPGSNFVYADVDGNIGYHAAGILPIRRGFSGSMPVDGASGKFEWDGYIPYAELPSVYNPPSGVIVTANQNPFPASFPYNVDGNFAAPYRVHQIHDRLTSHEGWRAGDMIAIQKDVYSGFEKYLATQIVAVYDKRNAHEPDMEDAITLLRKWDGQMDKNEAAPLITELLFHYVRNAMAERASPGNSGPYDIQISAAVTETLLRQRPEGWFRDYDETLMRAFVDALEEGRRMQGKDVKKWRWGNYMNVTIQNPVVHRVPYIGPYFDIAGIPMSGSGTTVKQTSKLLAPSMRMTADLGDWNRSLMNEQIGQAGQILSSHYRDQWNDWYYGQTEPMEWQAGAGKLEFQPAK